MARELLVEGARTASQDNVIEMRDGSEHPVDEGFRDVCGIEDSFSVTALHHARTPDNPANKRRAKAVEKDPQACGSRKRYRQKKNVEYGLYVTLMMQSVGDSDALSRSIKVELLATVKRTWPLSGIALGDPVRKRRRTPQILLNMAEHNRAGIVAFRKNQSGNGRTEIGVMQDHAMPQIGTSDFSGIQEFMNG
jgi:hypothetical protein